MEYKVRLAFNPDTGTWSAEAFDERERVVALGSGFDVVKACQEVSASLERRRNAVKETR